ncbi:MAG: hypothetical protein ACYC4U_26580 [Pirellulaceae bacterium]
MARVLRYRTQTGHAGRWLDHLLLALRGLHQSHTITAGELPAAALFNPQPKARKQIVPILAEAEPRPRLRLRVKQRWSACLR